MMPLRRQGSVKAEINKECDKQSDPDCGQFPVRKQHFAPSSFSMSSALILTIAYQKYLFIWWLEFTNVQPQILFHHFLPFHSSVLYWFCEQVTLLGEVLRNFRLKLWQILGYFLRWDVLKGVVFDQGKVETIPECKSEQLLKRHELKFPQVLQLEVLDHKVNKGVALLV